MKEVKLPIHDHLLLPITRFSYDECKGCGSHGYMYGGYRCNTLGCQTVFHKECAESRDEINHSSHPDHHPLELRKGEESSICSGCGIRFGDISFYMCPNCDFKLDLSCAKGTARSLENSNLHPHSLDHFSSMGDSDCEMCNSPGLPKELCFTCYQCDLFFHVECAEFFPEANHTSHPQHPLKLLTLAAIPDYADEKCLLCKKAFDTHNRLHHCDVCNFSICKVCMKYPPPVFVESPTTHEHQLHLFPRRIEFTCNACGKLGDRSPYFCLQCNFMIHRHCIDLPRVININRHDHRISYTLRLGNHIEWKCRVCREKVDGFYGAYTCAKCPSFAFHSLCATREDVWDKVELEEMLEDEEDIEPFKVIDDKMIKHVGHGHNLEITKDSNGHIQPENIVCEACTLQILSEPFYSCKECHFFLHEKCANQPRKKRHVLSNLPFTLLTDPRHKTDVCRFCGQLFSGFRYKDSRNMVIDVRCAAISDTLEHESHQQHSLYYKRSADPYNCRSGCKWNNRNVYSCDVCEYTLETHCALLPNKVMRNRYDDHPFVLSFSDINVKSDYWCEACETKVNPKEWFYTCNDCGTILHISCVVGYISFTMPGSHIRGAEVVSNTSICRPICCICKARCKSHSIFKHYVEGFVGYYCTLTCFRRWTG